MVFIKFYFVNETKICKASELFDKLNKFYTNLEWARAEKPTLLVDGTARTKGFFGGISEEGVILKDDSYNEGNFYDKLAFYVKQMSQEHDEFNIYLNMHGGFEGRILIINDMETNIPTLLAKIKENRDKFLAEL